VTTPPGTGLAPYVTPQIITQAPLGISWNTIPFGQQVSTEQHTAEQQNICARATSWADGYCNQTLRATVDSEFISGPDYYATVQPATQNIRVILSRWPVLTVNKIQVSPNIFPRSWTTLPTGYWQPENPIIGVYGSTAAGGSGQGGQAIIFSGQAGGGWWLGRNGYVFQIQYTNGWPHTQLTAPALAGASTIQVDDCSGWTVADLGGEATGARGVLYDNQQESATAMTSTALSGPGTLTLSAPLNYNHAAGVLFSAMPGTIQWACALMCASIALTRGATATAVHTTSGGSAGSGSGPKSADELMVEAELLLHSYKRVI
jgi:hypothetical protein